jgi:hypothetical protein
VSHDEQRAPRHFDVAVCAECHTKIRNDDPKVARGTGWLCQACAYALHKRGALT